MLRAPQIISIEQPVENNARETYGCCVNKSSKAALLLQLLRQLGEERALVFVNRRDTADGLVKRLQKQGWQAAAIRTAISRKRNAAPLRAGEPAGR